MDRFCRRRLKRQCPAAAPPPRQKCATGMEIGTSLILAPAYLNLPTVRRLITEVSGTGASQPRHASGSANAAQPTASHNAASVKHDKIHHRAGATHHRHYPGWYDASNATGTGAICSSCSKKCRARYNNVTHK